MNGTDAEKVMPERFRAAVVHSATRRRVAHGLGAQADLTDERALLVREI